MIEQLFTEKVKIDTILHKGMRCSYDAIYNKPSWFSFSIRDAFEYGNQVHTVKVRKDLKMINTQSLYFQIDFINQVNKKYGRPDTEHALALASVGLPSLKAQQAMLTHKPGDCDNPNAISHILAEYYRGAQRYSFTVGNEIIDKHLVNALIEFYPNFDGYIIPNEWPSCFHSGFFHKEVCIFRPRNAVVFMNTVKKVGGAAKKKVTKSKKSNNEHRCGDPRDEITIDDYNKHRKESMRAIGWGGPELYDKEGFLRIPTVDECTRFRQYRLEPDLPKDIVEHILKSRRSKGILTPFYDEDYWNTVKYSN